MTQTISALVGREMQRLEQLNKERKNTMPVKKAVTKAVSTPAAQKANESAAATEPKKKNTLASLEDVFDSTKPGSGGVKWPVGDYLANITNAELVENDKGTSVKFTYTGDAGEENEQVAGEDTDTYYGLLDKDGNIAKGIPFLKADLITLGKGEVKMADLEDVLKEITNEEPAVKVKVVHKNGYTNLYLQGLQESEE